MHDDKHEATLLFCTFLGNQKQQALFTTTGKDSESAISDPRVRQAGRQAGRQACRALEHTFKYRQAKYGEASRRPVVSNPVWCRKG